MIVGILSDSHGDALMTRRAMAIFDRCNAQHIIHCGDVGGVSVFDELAGRACTFVWGNTDEPDFVSEAYLTALGLSAPTAVPTRLTLGGKGFAVFHGHEAGFDRAADAPGVDYILHGHTHLAKDRRRGRVRIINPGALHRARRKTVAVLDTTTDDLTFHDVGKA